MRPPTPRRSRGAGPRGRIGRHRSEVGGYFDRARHLPAARSRGQSALRRQGEVAALARARIFSRGRRRALPGALPDEAGARLRHDRHRQREGSADPREQPDQAVQAPVQHPPQGRQILPEREGHQSRVAAHHRHPQDRQGWRPLLRSVRLGRRTARDHRRHPQSFSAAHLLRRGVPQSLAAVPRISDQAMPRAVLPAGRSRRVRPPSARGADAARRQKSRAAPRDARSDEGSRVAASNSRRPRESATACTRSKKPSSARPSCIIGESTRTSSESTARAATSRRSC